MAGETVCRKTEVAQARSAAYGLIATALRYPDLLLLRSLSDPARWTRWPDVIGRVDAQLVEPVAAVREAVARLGSQSESVVEHGAVGVRETYIRLFGHAVRGACPLYELEYGRAEIIQQSSILADIAGFYSAFGIEPTAEDNERPDHVSVECEFMSLLTAKEAHGCLHGSAAEMQKVVCDAQRSFLEDHLAMWLPSLARRVAEADPDGFYGAIARFAGAFVEAECRRLGAISGSALLELRPIDPTRDAAIDCAPEARGSAAGSVPLVQLGIDVHRKASPSGGSPSGGKR